jgi:hypothetical protein
MADESFDPKPSAGPTPARKHPIRRGCVALVALAALVFVVATWRASSSLDGRVATLKEQLTAIKAQPTERPVHFGPAVEGNAVDHLRAAEWILADPSDRAAHPSMVTPALERGHPKAHGIDLSKLLHDARDALRRGEVMSPAAADATRTYAPVLQHVRDGLRRGRCDWEVQYEAGVGVEIPNLFALRQTALLMALAAELEPDPRAAARQGLEVVAFGEDVARQRTLIAVMVGIAVKAIGLESLERTLRRGDLPREGYEEVITTLAAAGPTDLARGLETERLGMQVELARLSGRPLGPSTDTAPADGLSPGALLLLTKLGPMFFEHEWAAFFDYFTRFEQLMLLPVAERKARIEALNAELEGSWTIFAKLAVPNLSGARDRADESLAVVHALRLLAAAHLHRLESGAFPADAQPLAARLGGALPADPFRPAGELLGYAVKDGEVRVWSVGVDGTDDGGAGRWFDKDPAPKDVVVTGAAPAR